MDFANFYGGLVPAARRESQTPGVGVGKAGQVAWVGAKVCGGRMADGLWDGQAMDKQRNNITRMGVDSPSNMWFFGLNATGMVPGVLTRGANIMAKELVISLGKGGSITVDVEKLEAHPAVVEYIFNYGLKQMLNDVHAGEKEASAKLGLSQKKLDSLYEGKVAQSREGGGDPVAKEMRAMAENDLKAKIKALGKKISDIKAETMKELVAKQVAANEAAYRKVAEAKLAIKPASVESGISLEDLGL